MEFTAQSSDIAAALALVRGIVPTRDTIPILNHVKLTVEGGALSIFANDLEMQANIKIPCDGSVPGETTVGGHVFLSLVKAFPKGSSLAFKMGRGRASITSERSHYELPTLPAEDFPVFPEVASDASVFEMSAIALHDALVATRPTVSTEPSRYYLCGVAVLRAGEGLDFVSTDGHRLSRHREACQAGLEDGAKRILPSAAVDQILSILAQSEGTARMTLTERRMGLDIGDVSFVTKLIDGTYPDYERVIPQLKGASFSIPAEDLDGALSRLLSVTKRDEPLVVFKTNGSTLDIRLGRTSGEQGSEIIDADISSPSEFGCNGKYISDLLKSWPASANIQFQSDEPSDPILITSKDLPGMTQVLMPMRI